MIRPIKKDSNPLNVISKVRIDFVRIFAKQRENSIEYLLFLHEVTSHISNKTLSILEDIPILIPKKYSRKLSEMCKKYYSITNRRLNRSKRFLELLHNDSDTLFASKLFMSEYGWRMKPSKFAYRESIKNNVSYYQSKVKYFNDEIYDYLKELHTLNANQIGRIQELNSLIEKAEVRIIDAEIKMEQFSRWSTLLEQEDYTSLYKDKLFVTKYGVFVKHDRFNINLELMWEIEITEYMLHLIQKHLHDINVGKLRIISIIRDYREFEDRVQEYDENWN